MLLSRLIGETKQIRLGSGGMMLPNFPPLVVAEQFGMLEAMAPGRIDLGIGRAPGTNGLTASALRRGNFDAEDLTPDKEKKAGVDFKKGKTDPKKEEWISGDKEDSRMKGGKADKSKAKSGKSEEERSESEVASEELDNSNDIKKLKDDSSAIKPMLATLAGEVFDNKDWIYERKLDGYRILAHTGKKPSGEKLRSVYGELAKCLEEDRAFA
jgi:hypothetical protein